MNSKRKDGCAECLNERRHSGDPSSCVCPPKDMTAKELWHSERRALTDRISYLQIENDHLKAEAAICRERLGPAGYRILQEVVILRKVVAATAHARAALGWDRHRSDINSRTINRVLDVLDEHDRYMVQHK